MSKQDVRDGAIALQEAYTAMMKAVKLLRTAGGPVADCGRLVGKLAGEFKVAVYSHAAHPELYEAAFGKPLPQLMSDEEIDARVNEVCDRFNVR